MKRKRWPYSCLLSWVLANLLILPVIAQCASVPWLTIQGLEGVQASVSLALDHTHVASLDEMKSTGQFNHLPDMIREHGGTTPIWLKVELTVPATLAGDTAWLEIKPAHQWQIRVYTQDGNEQRGGFGIPRSQRSYTSSTARFPIKLNQPVTEIYLSIVTAAAQLTHISLLSEPVMQEKRVHEEWNQGVFWGITALILAITFMNWFWNRNPLYKIFSFYLAGASVLMLFMDGHITAYMFGDSPNFSRVVVAFSSSIMIVSQIYFGIRLLGYNKQYPRITRYLKYLAALILCSPILALNLSVVYILIDCLMGLYFLLSIGLVIVSAHQALAQRTARATWIFISLLLLSFFDKGPLLAILGLLPVQSWTMDLFKIGLLIQILLVHALLLISMQEQQRANTLMAQQSLIAAAKAESESSQRADLTRFLAMFGHEVRTPLAIIDSTTQSLELMPGADMPDIAERHERIRAAVDRLDLLANVALSRERIESLGWIANTQKIALHAILSKVFEKFELDLPDQITESPIELPLSIERQEGITFSLSIPEQLPIVEVDPHLLQIAIENLLDNACKYGDPDSTVKILVEQLQPVLADDSLPAQIKISVDSQGPVLSESDLVMSFEKYWRRDEQSEIGGAGLGLHLVHTIAKLHGGIAEATSFPGRWTRFSITFPIQATQS